MKAGWLRQVAPFKRISAKRLEKLLARAQTLRCAKGETLFRQGERADAVWIVLEGWVHLVRSTHLDHSAHGVVLFTITPREALCGVSVIEPDTYTATAIAGTDSMILRVPGEDFTAILTQDTDFTHDVVRLCAQRIRHMAEQYGTMAEPVRKRIVRTILRLREQFGETVPVTHRELAQMAWTTTETAIRTVRRLKREKFLSGRRGYLIIKNARALEKLLEI